jgi:hypothetical protein
VKPMLLGDLRQPGLTGQVLETRSSIDHAPVKEYPAAKMVRFGKIRDRERDRTPRKGDLVHPRQCTTSAEQLFLDDPPARLLYRGVSASAQFRQQRRLSAA